MEERLNEINSVMYEHLQKIDAIWSSDNNYVQCADEVIKEYAKCLGQISAIITAAKIDAKRGIK